MKTLLITLGFSLYWVVCLFTYSPAIVEAEADSDRIGVYLGKLTGKNIKIYSFQEGDMACILAQNHLGQIQLSCR